MSALLWGLFLLLAVVAALVVTLLMTPIQLDFIVRSSPEWRLKIAARLFAGLIPPIRIHDSARKKQKKKRKQEGRHPEKRKKKVSKPRHAVARAPRKIMAKPQLLTDLLKPIRLKRLTVDADIGFADPADTGQVFGLMAPVIYAQRQASNISVAIRPHFSGRRLSGEVAARLRFIPIAFLPPAARLGWALFGRQS